RNRLDRAEADCRRMESGQLSSFLLRRRRGGLSGLRLQHALLEFIDAPGGIDELLRAGVKGMADVANAQQDHGPGGPGLDHVATGAADFRFLIFRMYVSFHQRRQNLPAKGALTSVNLDLAPSQINSWGLTRLGLPLAAHQPFQPWLARH